MARLSSPRGIFVWVALVLLATSSVVRAQAVISGKLLDGGESAANVRRSMTKDWQIPLKRQDVDIRLLVRGQEKTWKTQTDEEGRFRVETDVATIPTDVAAVAVAEVGGRRLYSPSFDPRDSQSHVFLYGLGADPKSVNTITTVVHDVEKIRDAEGDETDRFLRVAVRVEMWNFSSDLYVGQPEADGRRRVCRIPLPPGAEVVKNEGFFKGVRARYSDDGRYLVWDEPVPGVADLLDAKEAKRSRNLWDVVYRVRPTRDFTLTYPLDLEPAERQRNVEYGGFRVYVLHELIEVESDEKDEKKKLMEIPGFKLGFVTKVAANPITQRSQELDLYIPSGMASGAGIGRDELLVPVRLTDSARGQVSRKALLWHGGTVLIGLVAMLLGLALSGKGPPPEAVLDGLSSEQVLDRIADLDERYARKEIREGEYQKYRDSLLAIAAEEIQAADGVASGGGASSDAAAGSSASPATGSVVSDGTKGVLSQIESVDESVTPSTQEIQQRAHLLEALYKSVKKDVSTEKDHET